MANVEKNTQKAYLAKEALAHAQQQITELASEVRRLCTVHEELNGARETIRVLTKSNTELTRQREVQDRRIGQLVDILEHVSIAAHALVERPG